MAFNPVSVTSASPINPAMIKNPRKIKLIQDFEILSLCGNS